MRQWNETEKYRTNPVLFARDKLKIEFWQDIADMLMALTRPPYRVSVDSGNVLGKTHAAAAAINWWFETFDPGVVLTTAPTKDAVEKGLWSEVRLQRLRAGLSMDCFIGPAAPEMRTSPDHWAVGLTARTVEAFHGKHRERMLFIFDEKEGVESQFWTGVKSMFRPGSGDAWLAIGNPLSTTSYAYQEHKAIDEHGNPSWHRVQLSALNHPNILAYQRGEPLVFPNAITPGQLKMMLADWCDPVVEGDEQPTDIEFDGKRYRPGPIAEPRILGLRPSAGTFGVWNEAIWRLVLGPAPPIPHGTLPIIGCDVANYGSDYTAFHVRCGPVSLYHQAVNGWAPTRVFGRLCDLAKEYAEWATKQWKDPAATPYNPGEIAIQIDDDAEGRTISDFLIKARYRAVPVNAGSTPCRPDLYANVRGELWFMAARKAAHKLLNLSRLDRASQQRIEMQAMAPEWWPDMAGRRIVESKDDLRKPERLGRSPDDMDAVNLAYYEPGGVVESRFVENEPAPRVLEPPQFVDEDVSEEFGYDDREDEPVRLFGQR